MKFRRFFIPVVAAVLVAVVAVTSIVPAYAAGAVAGAVIEDMLWDLIKKCITPDGMDSPEASYEENIKYLNKVWLTGASARKEVDYSTLSYVYAQLLVNGVPCEIRTSRGSDQGYYIRGTGFMPVYNGNGNYGIKDKYFSDGNGSVFYAELPDNGKTPDSTTVPSTTAPSIDKTESTETDHTYISDPSTPSDSSNELDALNRLIRFTVTQIKSIQGVWRTNINMYNIQIKMRSLMWNMIDGINNMTDGIYEQVDLLSGYLPRLDDIYERLFNIQTASWASVDAENRVFSAVAGLGSRLDTLVTNTAGIGSRLDSVINNGAVQVNTSSIDARLDKIISMYSKVNSVVLDTAAVNGGQITGAVGGALQDVMIYGRTRRENFQLSAAVPGLSVNGAPTSFGDAMLRSVSFTASVPSYITDDATLSAGLWKSGSTNYVSDTYNVATGEHIQRVNTVVLTGDETWTMATRAGSASIFYTPFTGSNLRAQCSRFNYVVPSTAFTQSSANVDDMAASFTVYSNALRFVSNVTSVDNWKAYLRNKAAEGAPVTVYWIPDPATDGTGSVSSWYADSATITIPEGDSTITADGLRVTGKYETYSSYTQTADIIRAINGLQLNSYDDSNVIAAITSLEATLSKPSATVTADLTEVTSRLDTLIENSASKIENTTINITSDNDAFNVFYITGSDGETQPITDFAKDLSSASGKFLSVLYRLVFSDALGSADSDLGNLEDFFTSTEPEEDVSTQSADGPYEEVDVWSAF